MAKCLQTLSHEEKPHRMTVEDIKEEIFESIKNKLTEIQSIEQEINSMYKEIETLQYEGKQYKSKSIEKMKVGIAKCFVELESFINNKKNELLVKVNELGKASEDDEKVNLELNQIKQNNVSLINDSTNYLNDKMAEYELMEYSEDTLVDIEHNFNEQMDEFNANILTINKLIDTVSIKYSYKFQLNSSIYKQLLNHIVNVGIIQTIVPTKDGDLIVAKDKRCELKSNYQYEFNNIILSENSKLTVKSWNKLTKSGGTLFIKCLNKCKLEKNSRITLSFKGYKGGSGGLQGESYNKPGAQNVNASNDGGGGTGVSGGGGGYGMSGKDGKNSDGGGVYGDDALSSMYMGSGGGGSERCNGGNGGGSLWLYCLNDIEMQDNSFIAANGHDGFDANLLEKGGGGGGAGGSIFIECNTLQSSSTSKITACGGVGGKGTKPFGCNGGDGGDGRICIKVKGKNSIGYIHNIKPKPFVQYR
eukprot:73608_1